MVNKANYVELGLTCANVCKVFDRGMRGKKLDDLSQSVCDAIEDLTKWVEPWMCVVYDSLTIPSIAGP